MGSMSIGKIAKASGIGVETVRFYERQGLLDEPQRAKNGYRVYSEPSATRLRFIKRAKALGFSLNEIREFLELRHRPGTTSAEIKTRTEEKLLDIRKKIRDLNAMKNALLHLSAACDGTMPLEECPILAALETWKET